MLTGCSLVITPTWMPLSMPLLWPAHEEHEQGLLCVQAVLGLLVDDRRRSVHDVVGRFFAAVRGEAVHEDRVPGRTHQALVHLEGREDLAALLRLGLLAHRRPRVGIDGGDAIN